MTPAVIKHFAIGILVALFAGSLALNLGVPAAALLAVGAGYVAAVVKDFADLATEREAIADIIENHQHDEALRDDDVLTLVEDAGVTLYDEAHRRAVLAGAVAAAIVLELARVAVFAG